jgi:LAO/AO transport system kinase
MLQNDPEILLKGLIRGDRVSLGRAITLAESSKTEHREIANQILSKATKYTVKSRRIGITGIPGAGKSTFIETYGYRLVQKGHKVAVLAVDPSGVMSKGSILGDKTRMEKLSTHPNAFIRPTPSGNMLGGVAAGTADAILLCEAAGYDTILVETVGVGQSETAVRELTDLFVLLAITGAGDELQGIKRGIMETADLIVVNKADSGNEQSAAETAKRIQNALHYFPAGERTWQVRVIPVSSTLGNGISDFEKEVDSCFAELHKADRLSLKRAQQDTRRFRTMINHIALHQIIQHPQTAAFIRDAEKQISAGKKTGLTAALEFENIVRSMINEKP